LFPFNPDRVLRVTPKPPTQSTVPRANEIKVGSCHQDEVPQTPVTPVSAEGLASLQNLIKQDVHTLNGTSIQHLERHVQKLANATQISFAERALLHDQNQMLTRMNNKAKVRRSTRSIVLGKAKVISFEDIEVARRARAAKEVIKGKGKRGRKHKRATLEADEPETEPEAEPGAEPEVAYAAKEAINGKGKRGRKRKSAALEADDLELELELELEVAHMIDAPVPWRAPVARMY
jgi:hypothetical protein